MKLTKEILENNNWLFIDEFPDLEYFNITSYEYNINNEYFITLSLGLSNHKNREWHCHIDNDKRSSIAGVDIDTVEHFNQLMQFMDINYELK